MKFILASNSPRRRQLLGEIITDFSVLPSTCDEKVDEALSPELLAQTLAGQKCDDVFLKNPDALVIGCDTIVVFAGEVLGKPKDEQDAEKTLKKLSGKTHSVITGVCVRYKDARICAYDESFVLFNDLDGDFIKGYIKGGSPMDKAGSYGIQDGGIVKAYRGSYNNIVGLPTELLKKIIDGIKNDKTCN